MLSTILDITYLLSALGFVLGMQRLSSPDTARRGNLLATFAMSVAILATLFYPFESASNNYLWIILSMIVGGAIGWMAAFRVQMTQMPQMVSIFNGLGGACAVALAMVELVLAGQQGGASYGQMAILLSALLIGGVSFSGSLLAYAKLEGRVKDANITFNGHNIFNLVLLAATLGLAVWLGTQADTVPTGLAIGLMVLSLVYGFSFVAPIGGADMPVVISLLNSFTGLSAAAAGLIYGNQIMLIGGIFVGASGTILTVLMCQAMNRSLLNVLIGSFSSAGGSTQKGQGDQVVKEITYTDMAIQMYYAKRVVFVPGYGLAVAQAQKMCKELDDLLSENNVEIFYGIHPVAGRMPGHMNVLLAEADVPYPKLLDLEEANDKLGDTDLAVIIGANDVVNPSAEDDPGSSIYGMPVLQVWEAKNVVVLKRSMRPGYAGIQNPLFFHDKTKMLFGDAKASLQELVTAVKSL